MKKVLVVGFTENPGGIENVVMNYYRNFDRNKVGFGGGLFDQCLSFTDRDFQMAFYGSDLSCPVFMPGP